jgi:hypothetical protein
MLFCLVLLASCTHAGIGAGDVIGPAALPDARAKAKFSWRSGFDTGNGEIESVLPGGQVYTGEFAQIRAQLGTATIGAYFIDWSSPAWAADPWYGGPPRVVTGVNSCKAVARLRGPGGSVMRCKFELRSPDSGLAGGASGECQVSETSMLIKVELPRGTRHSRH